MSGIVTRNARHTLAGMAGGSLLAALLALGLVSGASAPASAGWTEVKAGPGGHFMVQARINGHSTSALIDTSATVVVIPYRKAQQLGLDPARLKFDQPMWTADGKVMGAHTTLRRVEIDGVLAHDVEAIVLPRGALRHVLIGMSYLGKLRRYAVNANVLRLID